MRAIKTSVPPARSRVRVVAVVSAFAVILAGGAMIGTGLLSSRRAAEEAEIYTGVVRLPPDPRTGCRQFEFDNRSAILRPVRPDQCGPDSEPPPRPEAPLAGGSIGRVTGIGRYFRQ